MHAMEEPPTFLLNNPYRDTRGVCDQPVKTLNWFYRYLLKFHISVMFYKVFDSWELISITATSSLF